MKIAATDKMRAGFVWWYDGFLWWYDGFLWWHDGFVWWCDGFGWWYDEFVCVSMTCMNVGSEGWWLLALWGKDLYGNYVFYVLQGSNFSISQLTN